MVGAGAGAETDDLGFASTFTAPESDSKKTDDKDGKKEGDEEGSSTPVVVFCSLAAAGIGAGVALAMFL